MVTVGSSPTCISVLKKKVTMIFRYVLTVLFILGVISGIVMIDRERKPIGVRSSITTILINLIIIYGLWNWI